MSAESGGDDDGPLDGGAVFVSGGVTVKKAIEALLETYGSAMQRQRGAESVNFWGFLQPVRVTGLSEVRRQAGMSLLAVIPLTLLTRVFAITLKLPVTVFLLSGIFPLVPGAGIYYTAYYFIQNENALALAKGISTFKIAVALAIGISLVLCVPLPKKRK